MLVDRFGRIHDYLRISLTDACNLRCTYCMPEHPVFTAHSSLMQAQEVVAIAGLFVQMGITKIRLTGGEPLVRKDIRLILEGIAALRGTGLETLTLTTNGILLHENIDALSGAGVRAVNISMDTLMPERFISIAKRDHFHRVMSNIHLLLENQYKVKVNVVVMRGVNDDEVIEFIRWTRDYPVHVRFIEFMPFNGNKWHDKRLISSAELLKRAEDHFEVAPLQAEKNDTARAYHVLGHAGTFAFISTMTAPFCDGCNRIRLTADGKIKNCLFSKGEVDLLDAYRNGENLQALIMENIRTKEAEWGGQALFETTSNRAMVAIGG